VRIVSYNVNGIRAALNKGLADWLRDDAPDVVCFQELKAFPEQFDTGVFRALGYTAQHWHPAEKKGYSGVGLISRRDPDRVVHGTGVRAYDAEGRVLRADFGDLTVVSAYLPSGSSGDHRQEVKMKFLKVFQRWQKALRAERPNAVITGDYNICHRPIDIHDPVGNKNSSGFLPEERAWMDRYFRTGLVDSFRHFAPEATDAYTWWSYRAGARARNKGWRIDYQAVNEPLLPRLQAAGILPDALHSDHCPTFTEIDA
jgi:exodeoxyribonuclease-3